MNDQRRIDHLYRVIDKRKRDGPSRVIDKRRRDGLCSMSVCLSRVNGRTGRKHLSGVNDGRVRICIGND